MNIQTNIPESLWESVRGNYVQSNFTGAVLDALYFLTELLRNRSGADGDGAALVGQALGGVNPKIKINKDQSENEINIQKGLEQIIRGLYLGIRNPRVHGKFSDTEDDAFSLIVFIGFLVKQIEHAKTQFSANDFIIRVLEVGFVPSVKYAELLCEEVPIGQRLNVFYLLYNQRTRWFPKNMRLFFSALMKDMPESEKSQIYNTVSEEMKTINNNELIEVILSSFHPSSWRYIHEASRLRIEYRILNSMRVGKYDADGNTAGKLGKLAGIYFPYFQIQSQILQQICQLLKYYKGERFQYINVLIMRNFSDAVKIIPEEIHNIYVNKISSDDKNLYENLVYNSSWKEKTWSPVLLQTVVDYQGRHPDHDEIPF